MIVIRARKDYKKQAYEVVVQDKSSRKYLSVSERSLISKWVEVAEGNICPIVLQIPFPEPEVAPETLEVEI